MNTAPYAVLACTCVVMHAVELARLSRHTLNETNIAFGGKGQQCLLC
jgi:hypothetical protein